MPCSCLDFDPAVYEQRLLEPITERRVVDFGKGIGEKPAWLYNLPEVYSTHKYLKVPSASARFGTDPAFWNWAMIAVARWAGKAFLADRNKSAPAILSTFVYLLPLVNL